MDGLTLLATNPPSVTPKTPGGSDRRVLAVDVHPQAFRHVHEVGRPLGLGGHLLQSLIFGDHPWRHETQLIAVNPERGGPGRENVLHPIRVPSIVRDEDVAAFDRVGVERRFISLARRSADMAQDRPIPALDLHLVEGAFV